jgi:hypothetical protein
MRRRWGIAYVASTVALLAASAAAQPAADVGATAPVGESAAPPQAIGYGAMPGGLHAASAETLPKGAVQVATLGGFGWRSGLLADDHRFGRGIGNLAVAFGATPILTIGLSLDGRYDKHFGIAPSGDDGYVGDPHLIVRAAKASGNLKFGGQLGVWVPGKDAPSVAGSAISVDARGLVSLNAGPGLLSFSAGFRLDNSAKSVENPALLSVHDRVSLGVSEFNAIVAGVHLGLPVGSKAFVGVEAGLDYFVGAGETPAGATEAHEAPGPLIRFGLQAGFNVTPNYSVIAFVQGSKVPGLLLSEVMANDIRLVPYESQIAGGLGFQARFGGPKGPAGNITPNDTKVDIAVVETADVSGEVVDDTGKPVVGAKVDIKLKNNTGTAVTDDKGVWTVERIPIGKTVKGVTTLDDTAAEVTVAVDGKKPATKTLTLAKGKNTVDKLTLEAVLPPGQLRAVVRSVVTGKPLPGATVTIEPGGKTATSAADGTFEVDLAPGQYKIKVSSPGLKDQELEVTIDPNGVAIKNIELSR